MSLYHGKEGNKRNFVKAGVCGIKDMKKGVTKTMDMETTVITVGRGEYEIIASVTLAGQNIAVVIGGGEVPHIGAAAIGIPRESLKKDGNISATASVFCVTGHKDDMLARDAALCLSAYFNTVALVSVGLHVDNADRNIISKLEENFAKVILQVQTWIAERKDIHQ